MIIGNIDIASTKQVKEKTLKRKLQMQITSSKYQEECTTNNLTISQPLQIDISTSSDSNKSDLTIHSIQMQLPLRRRRPPLAWTILLLQKLVTGTEYQTEQGQLSLQ